MIHVVQARMESLGLLRPDSRIHCNVFVKLDNVLIDLFDEAGAYFYVRAAETYDLAAEYAIAETVARSLGPFVPRPLGFFREEGISCIVFEGVEFTVVSGADLLGTRRRSHLARSLIAYFVASVAALRDSQATSGFAALLRDVELRFAGTEQEELWNRVRAAVDLEYLATLPSQAQHGDFVPNNLGIRRSGLVVFDWEDFAKVAVPGFDLAVLLASCVDFDPNELRKIRDSHQVVSHGSVAWVGDACRALGLDPERFWRSVPFHLIAFLHLKDRYSPAIRAKVVYAIEGLL